MLHEEVLKFGNKNLDANSQDLSEGIDPWTLRTLWGNIFDNSLKLKV
jgi:hypothetical protein